MKLGIAFGCFIPLHSGHVKMIEECISNNDLSIIAVCGYNDDRGKDFIPFLDRYHLIMQKYANSGVIIVMIDDKKIGLHGAFDKEAWTIWGKELFRQANIEPCQHIVTWYTGETAYAARLLEVYPKHRIQILSRSDINISGSMIRENPSKYKDYIDPIFAKYLERKNLL